MEKLDLKSKLPDDKPENQCPPKKFAKSASCLSEELSFSGKEGFKIFGFMFVALIAEAF
jgi:hypothetical protein